MHNGKNDTSKPNPSEQMIKFNINPKSIYDKWGFKSSPFQTTALPASELGATLLTGRDEELVKLANRLVNAPKLPTVEGLNGVGKTSIANVASYVLYKQYLETRDGPLFIPCRTIFQLKPAQDLAIFADEVLYEVAQTLIERAEETKNTGITTKAINQWLLTRQLKTALMPHSELAPT